jgi:hypothetical protein
MALTFSEAMTSIHMRGGEVAELAAKGDALALKVMSYYRRAWDDFHAVNQDEAKIDPALKQSLISSVTEYLHRDLTLSDLADLQSKFGHRVPGQRPDPKKIGH